MPDNAPPRLSLSHSTRTVRDLDVILDFYCGVLGFHVTNRGEVVPGVEMAFVSQDASDHHQIAFVTGTAPATEFVMADHLAFRTGTLDDLRQIGERLEAAGVEGVIPISHGNAWSLYFPDPEGNGVECFVDSPFHVAQPHAAGLDIGATDEEIEADTRAKIEHLPEFRPFAEWQAEFAALLDARDSG